MSSPQPPSGQSGTPVATNTRHNSGNGATVVRRRKHGAAWLPWAILGLLALLALAVWALAKAADDDDEVDTAGAGTTVVVGSTDPDAGTPAGGDPSATVGGDPSATTLGAGAPAGTAAGTPGGEAVATTLAGAPGAGAPGALLANGEDLIAAGSAGRLGALAGAQVTGQAVVESVVSDEGFWVGSSPQQRIFVHLSPESRGTDGESPFQVVAGQTVTMTGSVVPFNDAAVAGVDAAEGLEQVRLQGAIVEALAVQLVG
jgi:hypothetical protein